MSVKLLVTFLLSVKFSLGALEDPDANCQNVYTYGYGYRKFYNLPQSSFQNGKIVFNFSLAAVSNGHVLFSEQTNVYFAYEVVLGAGGNEFSEIRKYNRHKMEPKTHLLTKNILSQMQPKNFSVAIKDSIVSVYYMNNNKWYLLMAWEDSSPLFVKYISFSSWTSVSGKWLFDCKGATAVPEQITPLKKLRKQLLASYDPYAVPASDIDKMTIDTSIELQYISLDAKKSILTTHGKFYFTWFDPKLQWNPMDFGNLSSITLLHREIWLPDFILYNSEDDGSSPMERAVIRIYNNGTVSWSPEAKLTTWCGLDLKNWPFDDHTCNVSLGLHSHPDHVSVSLSSKNVKPELILKDLEWKIVSLIGETSTIVNPWNYDESSEVPKAFTITVRLKRQVEMHLYAFVLKAELSRKQEEVKNIKGTNSYVKLPPKPKVPVKKNIGVEDRDKRDAELDVEEIDLLKKSKEVLAVKSKLYDELQKGNIVPDEKQQVYLVDFKNKETPDLPSCSGDFESTQVSEHDNDYEADDYSEDIDDNEWVEYTDCLGRTRKCHKSDLAAMKDIDRKMTQDVKDRNPTVIAEETIKDRPPELLSSDMEREMFRKKWEEQEKELLKKADIHYEDVLFDENFDINDAQQSGRPHEIETSNIKATVDQNLTQSMR
ncbi:unnamed protein product, partial [Nezara viridula]